MYTIEEINSRLDEVVNKVYNYDCLEFLKYMPDNFFDSVVTDPPYELGFMGKSWDSTGIANNVELWKEVLRVLKPGGYLLSFGGSRTYHRMACAIEDAGFEIRDMIDWVYGCLSEDTEILTVNGWERYHIDIDSNPILCYNIDINSFEFHKPKRKFIYENKHTAYRIESDKTDQIVSRNHRVVIEREGKLLFELAEEVAQEQEANIPFLESLHDLPETIYDFYKGAIITKKDLLTRVYKQNITYEKKKINNILSRNYLSCLWQIVSNKKKQIVDLLFAQMQWKNKGYKFNRTQIRQDGDEVSRNRIVGRKKSCLERWSNVFQKTWQLLTNKICEMSKGIFSDVQERWVCYGTSSNTGSISEQMLTEDRGCSPYKPQSTRQSIGKSNAIPNKQSPQITRSTITPIEYKGKVWCVEVPTGAFIARRNGKIFITGNSGFPKSLNIGKAVDKLQGNERIKGKLKFKGGTQLGVINDDNWKPKDVYEDKGTSKYEGWGTALKPAHEPICMARKPPSEKTVAENVLKWGTGGINIDISRVGLSQNEDKRLGGNGNWATDKIAQNVYEGGYAGNRIESSPLGRFPANLIHDGSDEVVALFPNTKRVPHRHKHKQDTRIYGNGKGLGIREGGSNFSDSGSAARFFYCAKASKSERNEGLDSYLTVKYNISTLKGGILCVENMEVVQLLGKVISDTAIMSFNIDEYGENITVQFHRDSLSTIKTELSTITELKILKLLQLSHTKESIVDVNCEMANGGNLAISAENLKDLINKIGILKKVAPHNMEDVASAIYELLARVSNEKDWKESTNFHSTVKPLALMTHLVKLVTPIGGIVLDPFAGSGSTLKAAQDNGYKFIGIEQSEEYCKIAEARTSKKQSEPTK